MTETIGAYLAARQALLEAIELLPAAALGEVFLGTWSVHDLVAHLVGWDYTNREAAEAVLSGRLPVFYSLHDGDWRTYNAQLVRLHKTPTVAATLAAARESHAALLAFLAVVPARELVRDHGVRSPRGRRVTIAILLQAEAADELKHAGQVRSFAASRGEPA